MTVKFKCNKKIMIIMLKLSQFVRSRCVIAEKKKDSKSHKTLLVLTEKSKISLVIVSFPNFQMFFQLLSGLSDIQIYFHSWSQCYLLM